MQLISISTVLKSFNYVGFTLISITRAIETDSYHFTFSNGEDKYFKISLTSQFVAHSTPEQIIQQVDTMVRTSPDLRRLAHHQQFYDKFDKVLNEE